MSIRLIVTENHQEMSRVAARLISTTINAQPSLSLVVATGNTPLQTYKELASLREQGLVDTSQIRPFQLDEYKGIPSGDPRSLFDWSRKAFLDPLGLPVERITRLSSEMDDVEAACQKYDEAVAAAKGFDLSILGLGPNGHLGFNEPPSKATDPTRQIQLTPASIVSNAVYWGKGNVPTEALTCGMNHLLAARKTLLLVSGAHKRDILWKTLNGPITPDVPSSYLQQASHVIVITDKAACPDKDASGYLSADVSDRLHA